MERYKKINWNEQKWRDYVKGGKGGFMSGTVGWPWAPLSELDGDYFAPVKNGEYRMVIIVEALDKDSRPIQTFTGINEGFMFFTSSLNDIPNLTNPSSIVSIPVIKTDDRITISADGSGNFTILCNNDTHLPESYAIINMIGQTVQTGRLSGLHRETVSVPSLRSGVYFITVNRKGGSSYTQKLIIK